MFENLNAPKLSAFYKSRFVADLTTKLILPSKYTAVKVRAGELDKKIGPFLLQLVFEAKYSPLIGTVPILLQIELPKMYIKPTTVISFEQSTQSVLPEEVDLNQLYLTTKLVASMSTLQRASIL